MCSALRLWALGFRDAESQKSRAKSRRNVGRCSMAVATSTLLGRPIRYELMTSDMKSAESFYKTVVGWKAAPFDG